MAFILLAESDPAFADRLNGNLQTAGHRVRQVKTAQQAFRETTEQGFDLAILDAALLAEEDVDLIGHIRQSSPQTGLLILTDPDHESRAVDGVARGALLFLPKTITMDQFFSVTDRLIQQRSATIRQWDYERAELEGTFGASPAMRRALDLVAKVAGTDATVLFHGETGTGKDLLAQALHRLSSRRDAAFVPVNCAALPEHLLESELFGFVKGAFTGADRDKLGLFSEADGGSIFLDEIAEMSSLTQGKLLRVLQDGEIRRLGETKIRHVDVRVIAATNQDLVEAVREKRFREDLYYRLNVVPIKLPPLRDRMESLPALTHFFVQKFNHKFNKSIVRIDEKAQSVLMNHDYPGNIRELENIIEHAVVMAENGAIFLKDLPEHITTERPILALPPSTEEGRDFLSMDQMEATLIRDTLAKCNGNQSKAAEKLGISRSTLWRKMKKYQIS